MLEYTLYILSLREVARKRVDDGSFFVLLARICREKISCELGDSFERCRVRIVEVVDGCNFVFSRFYEFEDGVRA